MALSPIISPIIFTKATRLPLMARRLRLTRPRFLPFTSLLVLSRQGRIATHARGFLIAMRLPNSSKKQVKISLRLARLDINSEGLLLLTNDGALAHELEKSNLPRDYRVRVFGSLELERIAKLQKGAVINGVRYQAVKLKAASISGGKKSQNQWLEMSLIEGKNREIRKMIEWCGGKVNRLIRTRFGAVNLENLGLKPGELQFLTESQCAKFFKLSISKMTFNIITGHAKNLRLALPPSESVARPSSAKLRKALIALIEHNKNLQGDYRIGLDLYAGFGRGRAGIAQQFYQ